MRVLRNAGLWLAALFLLAGCVTPPQAPVALGADTLAPGKLGRVGIAVGELPKADTTFPGAGCLLCMATASAANSKLTDHARTLKTDELQPLRDELAKLLRNAGAEVVLIEEPVKIDALPDRSSPAPNTSRKDFSALRAKYKVDRVLVVNFSGAGFTRAYSAYIPTSDPQGWLQGLAMLVHLDTHALEWYEPINVTRAAEGKWDEPPTFPGLTNAYYQALEMGMDQVKKPFARK